MYHSSIFVFITKRKEGKDGSIYNINTKDNLTNLYIVKTIIDILHKPYSLIEHVLDRLGHDRRYLMDSSRIEKELGFIPTVSFDEGIKETVGWYKNTKYTLNDRCEVNYSILLWILLRTY